MPYRTWGCPSAGRRAKEILGSVRTRWRGRFWNAWLLSYEGFKFGILGLEGVDGMLHFLKSLTQTYDLITKLC